MDHCQHRNCMEALQRCMDAMASSPVQPKQTRKPRLSQFEIFSLKYGSYGGIPTHKLTAARLRAKKKIALGAKIPLTQ